MVISLLGTNSLDGHWEEKNEAFLKRAHELRVQLELASNIDRHERLQPRAMHPT